MKHSGATFHERGGVQETENGPDALPRLDYPDDYTVNLRADADGVLARYIVRWGIQDGERRRWAVAMQVRRKDGRFRDVVRYDDWHGPLHRHRAGFPPGEPEPLNLPEGLSPERCAVFDVLINADEFLAAAQKDDDLEVEDDAST